MDDDRRRLRFEGKTALVTGAASGIGRATATELVAEGAHVCVGDIDAAGLEQLRSELGERIVTSVCDVTDESQVAALIGLAVDRFGQLDAGFNVAGAVRPGAIVDLTLEDWHFTVDLCLTGVFLCMKHEARAFLRQQNPGAIVNVASLNSTVPMHGSSSYCAAKAGVAMMSACGALEFGESGIRVNAVSPGLTETPMTTALRENQAVHNAYMERIPMRRVGKPEDIARAALFLASDEAGYISGVNVPVDGAWATSGYPDLRPFLDELAAARQA
jgi:NAD(P)-dependent dehydrogenase (short-subunit alcohol dehydrogenase family)